MNGITKLETYNINNYDPKLISILRNSLYPGAKEDSVAMVIEYCRHAKLDIMLKPVHLVPMWIVDKETGQGEMRDVIMPGINLYRIQASRSGCAGISEPEFGEDVIECLGGVDITYPKWCKVTVKRVISGQLVEFSAKEYWKENYATAPKDKKTGNISIAPNTMWRKRAYGQLAKCTEAQALRKAFPEIGAMPTAEEMEGKQLDLQEYTDIQKSKLITGKGVKALEEKLGIFEESTVQNHDIKTGEIIEENHNQDEDLSVDTTQFLIESASSREELEEVVKHIKKLSEEDKKFLRTIYKKKEAEFKNIS